MPKKRNIKIIITIFIAILAIVLVVVAINLTHKTKYTFELEQVTEEEAQYFVLQKNNVFGVIDKNGTVVIEPQYESIKIPNPSKDLFICLVDENDDIWKAVDKNNQQKWTKYSSVNCVAIRAITNLVPYEKTVLTYKQGNFYGLMDFDGNKLTEPIYEEISTVDYKEGYLKVKKEGSYGVINIKGVQILKEEYDDVLSDGYYDDETKYSDAGFILRVKTDDGYKYGYATTYGEIVLEPIYTEVNRLIEIKDKNNLYFITSVNGKYGFVKNSKNVLENDYREIKYDDTNHVLIVEKDSSFGVFDTTGKNVIPIDYDTILVGGEYINAYKGDNIVIFNKEGRTVSTDNYSKEKVSNNYSVIIDKDNHYNIVDKNDNPLLERSYTYLEYFKDDLFIATDSTQTGVIKANGEIVVPIQYSTVQKIEGTNCLQATIIDNNTTSIINSNGKLEQGLEMSTLIKEDNYIKILSDRDVKYYDFDGNEITYNKLFPNNKIYAVKKNDKWGFADAQGNIVINCSYDFVTEQNGNFAGVKIDGKWGVIDTAGNIIKDAVYEIPYNNISFLGEYYCVNSDLGLPIYNGD